MRTIGDKPHIDRKCVGRLFLSKPEPDYALVELEDPGNHGSNRVLIRPPGRKKAVFINPCGKITRERNGSSVIVVTSSGPIEAKLIVTPQLFWPENSPNLHMAYPIKVEGSRVLRHGDSGAGVIDPRRYEILGHVVRRPLGTSIAYIVPMDRIFGDISGVLDQNGFLVPQRSTEPRS
jgi:hypothetical protein